jgi:hypothetical protein
MKEFFDGKRNFLGKFADLLCLEASVFHEQRNKWDFARERTRLMPRDYPIILEVEARIGDVFEHPQALTAHLLWHAYNVYHYYGIYGIAFLFPYNLVIDGYAISFDLTFTRRLTGVELNPRLSAMAEFQFPRSQQRIATSTRCSTTSAAWEVRDD